MAPPLRLVLQNGHRPLSGVTSGIGEGESPGACDRPRDSTLCYDIVQIKTEGTGVKLSTPRGSVPSRSRLLENGISYKTPESMAEAIRALPVQKQSTRSTSPAVALSSRTCPVDSRPDVVVQSGVCSGVLTNRSVAFRMYVG